MSAMSPAQSQGIGSPIGNEAYNLITVLQSKLEGLEAYRKYVQDGGNPQLWQYLTQVDTQAVQYLTQELERLVQTGQFRLRQPGQTTSPGQMAQGQVGGTPIS
jgi:hypothetical protein